MQLALVGPALSECEPVQMDAHGGGVTATISCHRAEYLESYVFLGSPGTGKTTIARAMAQILHEVGVLGSNHVKVVSGLDMQGSFVGQTKDKVNEMMAEAQGGVLFIDEARLRSSSRP